MWPEGILKCTHHIMVPTNLCIVWKDLVRADIQLQLITCNSGQFEAIFLQCLSLLAIKAGCWLWTLANALSDEIHRPQRWGMAVSGKGKAPNRRWKTNIVGQCVFLYCIQVLPHTTCIQESNGNWIGKAGWYPGNLYGLFVLEQRLFTCPWTQEAGWLAALSRAGHSAAGCASVWRAWPYWHWAMPGVHNINYHLVANKSCSPANWALSSWGIPLFLSLYADILCK